MDEDAWRKYFKEFALLPGLDAESIELLLGDRASSEQVFQAGQVIIEMGKPGSSIYFMRKGTVSVQFDAEGTPINLDMITADGDAFFGEMGLIGKRRTATIIAEDDDTTVLEVPSTLFFDAIRRQPEQFFRFILALAGRLMTTVNHAAMARAERTVEDKMHEELAELQQTIVEIKDELEEMRRRSTT